MFVNKIITTQILFYCFLFVEVVFSIKNIFCLLLKEVVMICKFDNSFSAK